MTSAPATLTFLFTDLEGSTVLWEKHPEEMRAALDRHDAILRAAVEDGGGAVVKTTGDGIMAAFTTAGAAVSAALEAQTRVISEDWGDLGGLRVRMGLHGGTAHFTDDDYHGPVVNRAARIMAVANGGQILLSTAIAALVADSPPRGSELLDLGEVVLKGMERPERVYQLVHPALPREFPPLRVETPNNLPVPGSPFVGRETEIATVNQLLDGGSRIITLLGPGGTGKTRLAVHVAFSRLDRYPDGVFLVDLSAARHPGDVLALVARAAGLEEGSEGSMIEELVAQLRGHRMLLVLDNFEQVIAAAGSVSELAQSCPELGVVVTSREALRVRSEQVVPVPPLPVPDSQVSALEEIAALPSVRLFVERARTVAPGFELTEENAAAVAEVCRRLDGLPLALELAASRLNLFTPQSLLDRLGSGLSVLGGGPRDLPDRQRTLEATIGWSYQLLAPEERLLFCVLSTFSGIGLDHAEAVMARMEEVEGVDVIEALGSLVGKSLVQRVDEVSGPPRFAMLATMREYARRALETDPRLAAASSDAHATHFAELGSAALGGMRRRKRREVIDELAVEAENLGLAWRHWVERGDLDRLESMLSALWLLYDDRGWYRATVDLTTDLLHVIEAAGRTPELMRKQAVMLTRLARVLLGLRGYTDEVAETYHRAMELAEEAGDPPELFAVLRGLSAFYNFTADFKKGSEVSQKLYRLAEASGDPTMLLEAHLTLGTTTAFSDDLVNGIAHLDQAVDLIDPERDMAQQMRFGPYPGVASLTTSAFLLWMMGRCDEADRRARRALSVSEELAHPLTRAYAVYHVGFYQLWKREGARAADLAAEALRVSEEYDLVLWKALGHCLAGACRARMGDPTGGLDEMDTGIGMYQGLLTPPVFWPLVLFLKAGSLAAAGRPRLGLEVIDEAMGLASQGLGGTVLVPEFMMLKGDLVAASGDPGAEEWWRQALEVARGLDLRTCALRVSLRLARTDPGEMATLRDAHRAMTEGEDTPDMAEARELLGLG